MADDIVTRLLARLAPWQRDYLKKKALEAPRGKKVDLIIVDEIYVEDGFGVAPNGTTIAEAKRMGDIAALKGRVVVISGLEARRD